MISQAIRTAFLTIAVSVAGIAASAPSANAGGIQVGIYLGGGGLNMFGGHRRHKHGGYADHGSYRSYGNDRRWRGRSCKPRRAKRKARHMGLRDAYIARVKRRAIVVKGYYRGEPTKIKFGRSRHCPVIAVRSR